MKAGVSLYEWWISSPNTGHNPDKTQLTQRHNTDIALNQPRSKYLLNQYTQNIFQETTLL